jgi:cytosine permease
MDWSQRNRFAIARPAHRHPSSEPNMKLPHFLNVAKPTDSAERGPWYKNTTPAYAGIFLWFGFYMNIAVGTLPEAGLGLSILALVIATVLCYGLFYLVPALLGVKTGYPLYIVATSTYGTRGGFLMPGLLMGVLQFGWISVNIAISTNFILQVLNLGDRGLTSIPALLIAITWGTTVALIGLKGIKHVRKVATYLPLVCLCMLGFIFSSNVEHATTYKVPESGVPMAGMLTMITMVIGFFATAGAAGADIGMTNRNTKDVCVGGFWGIAVIASLVGILALVGTAGSIALHPELENQSFDTIIAIQGGLLGKIMLILFVVESFPPACFSSFLASNCVETLFPSFNKAVFVFIGVALGIVLAVTGFYENLIIFFIIIGASFGPICGSMAADYFLSGRKWNGPRQGINWAGYGAWAVGFSVSILPVINAERLAFVSPAPLIAFVLGFGVYFILAKLGFEPKTIPMPNKK